MTSGEPITSFRNSYWFLSNFFFPCPPVTLDGIEYPSTEHAYQAAKTLDPNERKLIRCARKPGDAKRLGGPKERGGIVTLRADWERVKVDIMRDLVKQKFHDPELRALLLSTGDRQLVEGNTWNDRIWGCVWKDGKWVGENWLGRILMEVRDYYRSQVAPRENA